MKKTLLATAALFTMSATSAVMAAGDTLDLENGSSYTNLNSDGAAASGEAATAYVEIENAANMASNDSFNAALNDSMKDVNSDNITSISEDGNVVHAIHADQAIATNDLDATVSGNKVAVGAVINEASAASGIGDGQNGSANNAYNAKNSMDSVFSNASGIVVVSQNTGHASSIQQSVVVQSNFKLN